MNCSPSENDVAAQAISSFGPLPGWQDAQGQPPAMLAVATPSQSTASAPQAPSPPTPQHSTPQDPPFQEEHMLLPVTSVETAPLSFPPSVLSPCPVLLQLPTPGGQMLPPPALRATRPLSSRPPAQSIESPSGSFQGRDESGHVSGRAGHHLPPRTILAGECLASDMY